MPLTAKGREIMTAMQEQYGKQKGKSVFYASKRSGKISGVDTRDDADKPGTVVQRQGGKEVGRWSPSGQREAERPKPGSVVQREAGKVVGRWSPSGQREDEGLVMNAPAEGEGKADKGPGHLANHVGKESEYHIPVVDSASPLIRAEEKFDEERIAETVLAHCDSLERRLDDCERRLKKELDENVSSETHMAR